MAKIIALANQKGGVGKTTSAVNIAASVGLLGKRVLLVDFDPQGNATSGVGINKKNVRNSSYEVVIGQADSEHSVIKTQFENLWAIPSKISLAGAEFDLYNLENREYRLKDQLIPLSDQFDYIFIDCPPSLGMLTINALTAADGIIIPMQCEYYALEGLSQLMHTIRRIKQLYNRELEIVGILITMYNGRLILSSQVIAELKKYYADKLFPTTISRNIKLTEAPGFGTPVFYHDKFSKGANEYYKVAEELLERI
ncbi:MAG: ParA family protein [Clostridiales bacterium]|nr:ParA family protein [Clostridiales bacterium]